MDIEKALIVAFSYWPWVAGFAGAGFLGWLIFK